MVAESGPRVSLVLTVLNEADTVEPLLESIARQTRQPDEVVVVDGGSTDGTWERLQAWRAHLPLVLFSAPGSNISQGRNTARRAANGELIAVTDAGVRLDPHWLERLVTAAEAGADVAAGFFRSDARSTFEVAMGATVLPAPRDVKPHRFLPSSRSVLVRAAAWDAVGGYPEWLDYCEDLIFDLALKRAGYRFVFVPDAVAWFRPRGSFRAFFRQYFLYARGDGKADLWRIRNALRYSTYSVVALMLRPAFRGRPAPLILLGTGAALYLRVAYRRLLPQVPALGLPAAAQALVLPPLIRLVGDSARMLGYPVGLAWRLRHRPPPHPAPTP